MIKALQESSIERIPKLLVPPADDPYSVLKHRLIEFYDLRDYKRAELLMALPQVDGDMPPSMLLNKMRALTPQGELEWPTSLLWYAFFVKTAAQYPRALCAVRWRGDASGCCPVRKSSVSGPA